MTVHDYAYRGEQLYIILVEEDINIHGCTIVKFYKKEMNGHALCGACMYIKYYDTRL